MIPTCAPLDTDNIVTLSVSNTLQADCQQFFDDRFRDGIIRGKLNGAFGQLKFVQLFTQRLYRGGSGEET